METDLLRKTLERTEVLVNATETALKRMLGETPFGAEERSRQEQRRYYEALTPADVQALVTEYGADAVEKYISDMEGRYAR